MKLSTISLLALVALLIGACGSEPASPVDPVPTTAPPTSTPVLEEPTPAPTVTPISAGPTPTPLPVGSTQPQVAGAAQSPVGGPTDPPLPRGPIQVPTIQTFRVGGGPTGIMFDGESVWIANQSDDTIQRLEPDGSEGLVVPLPDFYPRALAYDGDTMWLATFFGIRMLSDDYQIVASFRPGRRPAALKYAGGYIFASNNDDGTITALALPEKIRELGGEMPAAVPPDHTAPTPIGNYKVGSNPIAMEWDGSNLWVANNYDNTVMKLRPIDGTILATVEVGRRPQGYGVRRRAHLGRERARRYCKQDFAGWRDRCDLRCWRATG